MSPAPEPGLIAGTVSSGAARPPAGAITVKPARRRDPLSILLVVAAFVAIGGVGFAVGRTTAPAPVAAAVRGGFGGNSGNGGNAGNGGFAQGGTGAGGTGRFGGGQLSIRGTVTAITSTELTLTLANGGTVNIPLDSSTTYHRQAGATSTDVTTGATVLVQLAPGGGLGGPNASRAPSASGAPIAGASPGAGGARALGKAQDITVVGQ